MFRTNDTSAEREFQLTKDALVAGFALSDEQRDALVGGLEQSLTAHSIEANREDDALRIQRELSEAQALYIFQTTPEQDAAIQSYMAPYAGHMNDVGYIDNCAARTSGALNAAGINPFMMSTSQPPFMVPSLLGYGLQNSGVQGYYIPQGGRAPDLSQFNHN